MLIGYMRVSSESDRQKADLQRDALLAAGIDERHLFEDRASGAKDNRPGLIEALDYVKSGDCFLHDFADLIKLGMRATRQFPDRFTNPPEE